MTDNPDTSTPENAISGKRAPWPFLGIASVIAGAILPLWAIIVLITGGIMALAWVPVMVLSLPYNLVFFILFLVAVLCGIFALRKSGADRMLGRIGLILAGMQLVAIVAYVIWVLTDISFGG